jgi:Flp pilus assembly pilin Flp
MNALIRQFRRLLFRTDGSVCVEYLLVLTIVGVGAVVGLATLRDALIDELTDLAESVSLLIS